jgi:hypothetical protein
MEKIVDKINKDVISIIENIIKKFTKCKNGECDIENYNHGQILKNLYIDELNNETIYLKKIEEDIMKSIENGKHVNFFGKFLNSTVNFFIDKIPNNPISLKSINNILKNTFKTKKAKSIDEVGTLFIYIIISTLYMLMKNKKYKYNFNQIKTDFNLVNELTNSVEFYINSPKKIKEINSVKNIKYKKILTDFLENEKYHVNYNKIIEDLKNTKIKYDEKFSVLNTEKDEKLFKIDEELPLFDNMYDFIYYIKNNFENVVYNYIDYENVWFFHRVIFKRYYENIGKHINYIRKIPTYLLYYSWIFSNQKVVNDFVNTTVLDKNYDETVRIKYVQKEKLYKDCKKFFPILNNKSENTINLDNLLMCIYQDYLVNFRNYYYDVEEFKLTYEIIKKMSSLSNKIERLETKIKNINEKLLLEFFEEYTK